MEAGGPECVVLLHGLARTSRSMRPMARFLEREGFRVRNIGYPSTRYDLRTLADYARTQIEALADRFSTLHFVTHSMGGIVLRQIQVAQPFPNIGRVVMLSPPNRGSQVVDKLGHLKLFRWLNGPAGQQLGTSPDSVPNRLGAVGFALGVITGDRSINWILSALIGEPNDGKVAVSHAGVTGQIAMKVVHAAHPLIMRNREAQANALAFLRKGAFLDG